MSARASLDEARESFLRLRDSMPSKFASLQKTAQSHMRHRSTSSQSASAPPSRSQSQTSLVSASPPTTPLIGRAPPLHDPAYNHELAALAQRILFRSGTCPVSGGPLLLLCATAFPDANEVDYDALLPYVLANLPGDDELGGMEDGGAKGGYSVVFFAGADSGNRKERRQPTWHWTLKAYGLLGRAVRKKIRKLWIVHERHWVRVIFEALFTVVSPKFRRKVIHLNTLTDLAQHIEITPLLIPPAVYLQDRKLRPAIEMPGFPRPPVFGAPPFASAHNPPHIGDATPLPTVLNDTSNHIRTHGLDTEGLFRVPAAENLVGIVAEAYDRRQQLHWPEWSVHVAASIVKRYYRALPRPIIPQRVYHRLFKLADVKPSTVDRLMAAAGSPPPQSSPEVLHEIENAKFETVQMLLTSEDDNGLPPFARVLLLRHLLPLLSVVASNQGVNKMSADNLAICVAPSLYNSGDPRADMQASPGIIKFVEIAILRLEELAPRPPLRRHPAAKVGAAEAENKRASWASGMSVVAATIASRPNTPPDVPQRKRVSQLTMPRWENIDEQAATRRKPVPESPEKPGTTTPGAMTPSTTTPTQATAPSLPADEARPKVRIQIPPQATVQRRVASAGTTGTTGQFSTFSPTTYSPESVSAGAEPSPAAAGLAYTSLGKPPPPPVGPKPSILTTDSSHPHPVAVNFSRPGVHLPHPPPPPPPPHPPQQLADPPPPAAQRQLGALSQQQQQHGRPPVLRHFSFETTPSPSPVTPASALATPPPSLREIAPVSPFIMPTNPSPPPPQALSERIPEPVVPVKVPVEVSPAHPMPAEAPAVPTLPPAPIEPAVPAKAPVEVPAASSVPSVPAEVPTVHTPPPTRAPVPAPIVPATVSVGSSLASPPPPARAPEPVPAIPAMPARLSMAYSPALPVRPVPAPIVPATLSVGSSPPPPARAPEPVPVIPAALSTASPALPTRTPAPAPAPIVAVALSAEPSKVSPPLPARVPVPAPALPTAEPSMASLPLLARRPAPPPYSADPVALPRLPTRPVPAPIVPATVSAGPSLVSPPLQPRAPEPVPALPPKPVEYSTAPPPPLPTRQPPAPVVVPPDKPTTAAIASPSPPPISPRTTTTAPPGPPVVPAPAVIAAEAPTVVPLPAPIAITPASASASTVSSSSPSPATPTPPAAAVIIDRPPNPTPLHGLGLRRTASASFASASPSSAAALSAPPSLVATRRNSFLAAAAAAAPGRGRGSLVAKELDGLDVGLGPGVGGSGSGILGLSDVVRPMLRRTKSTFVPGSGAPSESGLVSELAKLWEAKTKEKEKEKGDLKGR